MEPESVPGERPEPAQVKPIIGMIHVGGTARHARAQSADHRGDHPCWPVKRRGLYQENGVNCLMIENMHDVPYLRGSVGPEIVASMTAVALSDCARKPTLPMGLQILAAADLEAVAVAHAAGLDFVRTECFSFAHVADEGIMESNAAKLLRYRRAIGATAVQVWADIKKKHASHAWTADLSLGDIAEAAEFMGAETLIVTGSSTGKPPQPADVVEARERCQLPVFVGSGVTLENLEDFLTVSDGLIIGSHFKRDGHWRQAVDPERVQRLMEAANRFTSKSVA